MKNDRGRHSISFSRAAFDCLRSPASLTAHFITSGASEAGVTVTTARPATWPWNSLIMWFHVIFSYAFMTAYDFFPSYFRLFSVEKEPSSEEYHSANRQSCTWTFILAFPKYWEPDFVNSAFLYCMLPKPSLAHQRTNILGARPCKILKLFL